MTDQVKEILAALAKLSPEERDTVEQFLQKLLAKPESPDSATTGSEEGTPPVTD